MAGAHGHLLCLWKVRNHSGDIGFIYKSFLAFIRYEYALHAIQHARLLAPQSPFHALHAAEVAYTAGDVPLAARLFLCAAELAEDPESETERGGAGAPEEAVPEGVAVRAWFGVKQVRDAQLSFRK